MVPIDLMHLRTIYVVVMSGWKENCRVIERRLLRLRIYMLTNLLYLRVYSTLPFQRVHLCCMQVSFHQRNDVSASVQ